MSERTVPRGYDGLKETYPPDPSDDYSWYRAAMRGDKPKIHEGQPAQCGFYQKRRLPYFEDPKGPIDRVAIWKENGRTIAAINGDAVANPDELWLYVARKPISEKLYRYHEETGEWPPKEKRERKRKETEPALAEKP